jgi:hypothetical protein
MSALARSLIASVRLVRAASIRPQLVRSFHVSRLQLAGGNALSTVCANQPATPSGNTDPGLVDRAVLLTPRAPHDCVRVSFVVMHLLAPR